MEKQLLTYEVIATVSADSVDSTETATVRATDNDDACGVALGQLRGRFGDDAEIHVRKILKQGSCGVLVAA